LRYGLALEPQPFIMGKGFKGGKPFLLYGLALEPQPFILGKGGLREVNPFCYTVWLLSHNLLFWERGV